MSEYTDEINRVFHEHREIVKTVVGGKVEEEALLSVFLNLSRTVESGFLVISRQIEGAAA
jgi:hypothetical protein